MKTRSRNEFAIPLIALAAGVAYLVAGLIGGDTAFGVIGLAIMVVFAVMLWLVRRRSETVKGLMDRRDERINTIDLKATALAGGILMVVIVVAFVVEIARGNDGAPYDWLALIGGVSYTSSLIVFRIRG